MYGSTPYAAEPYGGEQFADTTTLLPPLIALPFTIYAPAVAVTGEQTIMVPLVSNAFQVFAPASIETHGRPLAEDIRIMRVRRAE
jgi:hypothetical protein